MTHQSKKPVSPHYQPLEWTGDESDQNDLDIEAHGQDWIYQVWSISGEDDEAIGYEVRGGDIEESDDIGYFPIDGDPDEQPLQDAKAAAQENYAKRYLEAESLLYSAVSGSRDDDGNPIARCDTQGRIFCRSEHLDGEIEIVATLQDNGDDFDVDHRCWTVCLRSILEYLSSGDWIEGMHHDMRRAGVSVPNG